MLVDHALVPNRPRRQNRVSSRPNPWRSLRRSDPAGHGG